MFTKGDNFLHFTKYGGVNKGEVASLESISNIDTVNNVVYKKYFIRTTNGVCLNLDGSDGKVYLISRELSNEEVGNIKSTFAKMSNSKLQAQFNIEEKIKTGKLKFINRG